MSADDLNFSKHVAPPEGGAALPESKRQETVQPSQPVAIAHAFQEYGSANSLLSNIGSKVASTASNALATQLGRYYGKNPNGNLLPAITNFDKQVAESYKTQAQSTLGLQASKLITDSNIELSKASRLTPEMIAKNQQKIHQGLQSIYANAPDEIRPQMEHQYGLMQMSQVEQLTNRMIGEQHEQRRNLTILSNAKGAEIAHSLAVSGHFDEAMNVANSTERLNRSAIDSNIGFTELQGKVGTDTVRKAAIDGRLQFEYHNATDKGAYLKSLTKKPDWISEPDHLSSVSNLYNYANQQEALKHESENVVISGFHVQMAKDLGSITGTELEDAKSQLSPTKANELEAAYYNAINKRRKDGNSVSTAKSYFTDPNHFTDSSAKINYAALNEFAQAESERTGIPISEALMHQAAIAAGPIKPYTDVLGAKLSSGNPRMMKEAMDSVDYIGNSFAPQNLIGIDPKALTMGEVYQSLADTHDEQTAAQMAKETVYGQTPEDAKAIDESYNAWVRQNKAQGQTDASFALDIAQIDKDAMVNIPHLSDFIKSKMGAYYKWSRGNLDVTKKLLKDDINKTFDYDTVNGYKRFTYLPLKKVYNLPENSNGFIHAQVAEQVGKQFEYGKSLYDNGKVDFYWEIKPQFTINEVKEAKAEIAKISKEQVNNPIKGIFDVTGLRGKKQQFQKVIDQFSSSAPPSAILHYRDGSTQTYELSIDASPGLSRSRGDNQAPVSGYYDVNIKTGKTITSISQADPHTGPIYYKPDRQAIMDGYNALNFSSNQSLYSDLANAPKFEWAENAKKSYGEFIEKNESREQAYMEADSDEGGIPSEKQVKKNIKESRESGF